MKETISTYKLFQYLAQNNSHRHNRLDIAAGFNLVQMIVTLTVFGILSAIAAPTINLATNPLLDTSRQVKSQIKLARTKALSTTTAHRLKPISTTQIEIQKHLPYSGPATSTCENESTETDGAGNPLWETIAGYGNEDFKFKEGIQLKGVSVNGTTLTNISDWQLCFDSRGISNQTIELEFTQVNSGKTIMLEAFRGGSVDIN